MARAFLLLEAMAEEEAREDRHRRVLETARLRRELRFSARPLNLSDAQFKAHYRLTKELFMSLCSELCPLMRRSIRSTKVELKCKVLTALSFYATGSYQKPVGMSYLHALSQSSVSLAVREVTMALNNYAILAKYIRFPQTPSERRTIINGFSNKFSFPGVLGCVDGTHVALVRPSDNEERFFNRKHYHSRNIQIVSPYARLYFLYIAKQSIDSSHDQCWLILRTKNKPTLVNKPIRMNFLMPYKICDSDLNILNVDATYGGATHDAYIWRNSIIHDHIQDLHRTGDNFWFLGDSGYPLRPWLLTPIVNAAPGSAEEYYTNMHTRTRNTVERCIGVMKARWRCLLAHRVLHYDDGFVAKIINACCVLHNITNKARLSVPELTEEESARDRALQVRPHAPPPQLAVETDLERGRQNRAAIVQRLWLSRTLTD